MTVKSLLAKSALILAIAAPAFGSSVVAHKSKPIQWVHMQLLPGPFGGQPVIALAPNNFPTKQACRDEINHQGPLPITHHDLCVTTNFFQPGEAGPLWSPEATPTPTPEGEPENAAFAPLIGE